MEITNTEKGIIGVIIVLFAFCVISIMAMSNAVEKAGGLDQVIIDAGREVKHIGQEIAKD